MSAWLLAYQHDIISQSFTYKMAAKMMAYQQSVSQWHNFSEFYLQDGGKNELYTEQNYVTVTLYIYEHCSH